MVEQCATRKPKLQVLLGELSDAVSLIALETEKLQWENLQLKCELAASKNDAKTPSAATSERFAPAQASAQASAPLQPMLLPTAPGSSIEIDADQTIDERHATSRDTTQTQEVDAKQATIRPSAQFSSERLVQGDCDRTIASNDRRIMPLNEPCQVLDTEPDRRLVPHRPSTQIDHGSSEPFSDRPSQPLQASQMSQSQPHQAERCKPLGLLKGHLHQDTFGMLERAVEVQSGFFKRASTSTKHPMYFCFHPDILVQFFFDSVVISNVIVLGPQAGSTWRGWLIVNAVYAVTFVGEIIHRFWAKGFVAVLDPCTREGRWGLFDIFLAGLSVFDVVVSHADSRESRGNMGWLRMARLVRIARVLRLLQIAMFRDLLLMINGAVGGLRTLLWSVVLIAVPIYVFGLFFTEMIGTSDVEVEKGVTDIKPLFETVSVSMFTGFRCLVVGDCSASNGTPLFVSMVSTYGWGYGMVYSLTSVCMSFGLFNVIIAIYVENTVAAAKSNEMIQHQRRLDDHARFAEKLINLVRFFWKNNPNNAGDFNLSDAMEMEISEDYYQSFIEKPEFHKLLNELDIHREDHKDIFEICDADSSGTVSMTELVAGVRKLRGDPRRSDLVYVMLRVHELLTEVQEAKHIRTSVQSNPDSMLHRATSSKVATTEYLVERLASGKALNA